jgi:hypothetical protein
MSQHQKGKIMSISFHLAQQTVLVNQLLGAPPLLINRAPSTEGAMVIFNVGHYCIANKKLIRIGNEHGAETTVLVAETTAELHGKMSAFILGIQLGKGLSK